MQTSGESRTLPAEALLTATTPPPTQTDAGSSTANSPYAAADLAALVPLLQRCAGQRLPLPSFAAAPPVPLPLWQRITLSALNNHQETSKSERKLMLVRQHLGRDLTRYHVELHERAERQRQEQRESRARVGERVARALQKFWSRRGDAYEQLMKVEFDVVKHQHDRRKQEDLLRETEMLTRRLLESFFQASNRRGTSNNGGDTSATTGTVSTKGKTSSRIEPEEDGSNTNTTASAPPPSPSAEVPVSFWAKVGDDDDAPIEDALSLLNCEQGRRPLRHYQRSSLRWMVHLYENNLNGILADEMGLGKTVQTIALLCYFAEYRNDWGPHLIVVPTTVVLNWKAELQRWAPGLKVLTYIGAAKERLQLRRGWMSEDAFHICVTSYNLIVQDRKMFRRRPWGFLVLDEAHQVKNFMSLKWQSLFDLQAEYRLLLTGTPLQNSIMELWSLFHFLLPFASAFRSNAEFKEWFSNPMDAMITGRSSLNEDIVRRLQALLRPFMLRRLKKDVESQLPTKTEKVVLCHLSRRQRSLYDDYMQLAETRQKLSGGGAGGVLSVLLALRKVCDHPDLFEERPTISPLVLGYAAAVEMTVPRAVLLRDFAGPGLRARRRFASLFVFDMNADGDVKRPDEDGNSGPGVVTADSPLFFLETTTPWWLEQVLVDVPYAATEADKAFFAEQFRGTVGDEWKAASTMDQQWTSSSVTGWKATNGHDADMTLQAALAEVLRVAHQTAHARACQSRIAQQQRYFAIQAARHVHVPLPCMLELKQTLLAQNFPALCPSLTDRAAALLPMFEKVCVYVPAVLIARPIQLRWLRVISSSAAFERPDREVCAVLIGAIAKEQDRRRCGRDPPRRCFDAAFFLQELWPIQVRRSFSFPDKRLLIHDCGKLQYLEGALKEMRQAGHRVLIFTQFVNMLNILERFLALIGAVYMRLDGSTRAEVRQQLVDRFNADERVTCMILSTRSGGVGLNLTGADTVIFYDSDWNPTMDLQAQDRCHRIGQTRPVTIYRLISEHTVEESILRKARERKKLNNVVIRGGQFHTIAGVSEQYEDSAAAFAALSDPVNLRSFFHDLDEDATVAEADGGESDGTESRSAAAMNVLTAMAEAEDEEDREAGQQMQREIDEREAAEAVEGSDEEEEEQNNGSSPQRKRVRTYSTNGDEKSASDVMGITRAPDPTAWQRKGPNSLLDHYLLSSESPMARRELRGAEKSPSMLDATVPVVKAPPSALETASMVRTALRKRRREMVQRSHTPVDQLLTLLYGQCRREDAEERYADLVATYTAQMDELGADSDSEGEEEGSSVRAQLPRFHLSFHLGPTS